MLRDEPHLSDHDLLLAVDAELTPERELEVRSHLARCEKCRERMHAFERTSADLAVATRSAAEIPDSADARRDLLRRLRLASSTPDKHGAESWLKPSLIGHLRGEWRFAVAVGLLAVAGFTLLLRNTWLVNSGAAIAQVQAAPLPLPSLTPGDALHFPNDICFAPPREDSSRIPISERERVFREYGVDYRRAKYYELDHLITPALGGTDDIRNLWPEPYNSTEWNAHVKDQLEDYLHLMVCSGQIDLTTAQHDIATNWIEAYKRYFHTDKPLPSYPAALQAARETVAKS